MRQFLIITNTDKDADFFRNPKDYRILKGASVQGESLYGYL